MIQVTYDPDVYKEHPPTIVKQISAKLEDDFFNKRIRAKRKWLEVVEVNDIRYSVVCHMINENEVMITRMHSLKKGKNSKSRKKEARMRI